MIHPVQWRNGTVVLLDQRLLPTQEVYRVYRQHREVARAIRALWQGRKVTLEQPYYPLVEAETYPLPPRGGLPLVIGWRGEKRTLRVVAECADGWNQTHAPESFPAKRDALLRHCEAVGRDPAEIEISAQVFLRQGHAAALEAATYLVERGVQHVILIMPAAEGPAGLQRLADEVAVPLRERFG